MMSPILVADILEGQRQKIVEEYMIHQYRFQQFSRTALVVPAIAIEVREYCKLQNDVQIAYLWHVFAEHVPEGKDMFKMRYETLLEK